MRQRKIKDLEIRRRKQIEKGHLLTEPELNRGSWRELFAVAGKDIFLEIGCGKGKFIKQRAETEPENLFIGLDAQPSVIVLAAEKREDTENLLFVERLVKNIGDIFEEGELSGIYLNFSDPWHKARHAKRRLTCEQKLKQYFHILKPGGFVELKTDNDNLYRFTIEEAERAGLSVAERTKNLHDGNLEAGKITTEYEDKFIATGKNINYLKITDSKEEE